MGGTCGGDDGRLPCGGDDGRYPVEVMVKVACGGDDGRYPVEVMIGGILWR